MNDRTGPGDRTKVWQANKDDQKHWNIVENTQINERERNSECNLLTFNNVSVHDLR